MRIFIGTSGFQYPEWKGTFYPEKLSTAKMLVYYAERFSTTESNYSFRHIPSAKTIEKWRTTTPEGFCFSFKAPQKVTHFAKLRQCGETMAFFHQAVLPLGGKLGAVLFQLPPGFKADVAVLRDFLGELPPGLRAAFEFRHDSWFTDATYEVLRSGKAALCIAESEELATPAVATADFGYLRLRREDYQPGDLDRWSAWISSQSPHWQTAYIYLKHEETGVGPKFAKALQERLAQLG
jgi:uncharacterized protein YecE (DUF72 family)